MILLTIKEREVEWGRGRGFSEVRGQHINRAKESSKDAIQTRVQEQCL